MADLRFALQGRFLPVDHAAALRDAVARTLPWIVEAPGAGIHRIHVAASSNGWQRPEGGDALLVLARRTRLELRVPVARLAEARRLEGTDLEIWGHRIRVGRAEERPLRPARTLFAREVAGEDPQAPASEEAVFAAHLVEALARTGLDCRELVCGRAAVVNAGGVPISTRSVMLDGCTPESSMRLQEQGFGPGRALGCGIFVPHKRPGPSPEGMED